MARIHRTEDEMEAMQAEEEIDGRMQEVLASAEYDRRVEVLNRHATNYGLTDGILSILASPTEPIDDSKENIEEMLKYCIGHEADRSAGSAEAADFDRRVFESFETEWRKFVHLHPDTTVGQAMLRLPPKYIAGPLTPSQSETLCRANPYSRDPSVGAVRIKIQYYNASGLLCSTMREVPFEMSASDAIASVVDRIRSVLQVDGPESPEYLFKVVGRNEFIYGPDPFINFRFIRESLLKQNEVNLSILKFPYSLSVLHAPRFYPVYDVVQPSAASHEELTVSRRFASWKPTAAEAAAFSLWEMQEPVNFSVVELTNVGLSLERAKEEAIRDGDDIFVCVVAELYFGGHSLCAPKRTPWRCLRHIAGTRRQEHLLWSPNDGRIIFDVQLSDVPREIRFSLSIVACAGDNFSTDMADISASNLVEESATKQEEKLMEMIQRINPMKMLTNRSDEIKRSFFFLGSVNAQLFDHTGQLRTGLISDICVWESDARANPISMSSFNPDPLGIRCVLDLPRFAMPVIHPGGTPPLQKRSEQEIAHNERLMKMDIAVRDNKIAQLRHIKRILGTDPLYEVTPMDRVLLWQYRTDLRKRPKALPKFLTAVDWLSPAAVAEGHALMENWARMQPMDALQLLDAHYADLRVREYAVQCLDTMSDYELHNVLLQLVQVLKYEPYHYSALARFLLRRSLRSPHYIGHIVFWHLRAEMYNAAVSERHAVIIREYLRRLQSRRDVLRQVHVVQLLLQVALKIKSSKKEERLSVLRAELDKIVFPPVFTLALNPTMECVGLDIVKCKVMDSKKLPLWLVFRNADPMGPKIYTIFKAGDDLRQDLLTLQMLELMDDVWKRSGLDLHMIPYGCVATGDGVGMIEVVLKSDTIANITRRDGGARAAFLEEPLMNWLRKFNSKSPSDVEKCLWNFVYSTAGYCVATYVLGIGDRHNDNIMVREDGTLFHIDFGHFLGNFKTKFGFKRETAPFIFTPMYAYMMGGTASPIYTHFCDIACQAYNIIRRHTNLLITLFMLMLSTGIPELQKTSDIVWLKTVLRPEDSDAEAARHFRTQIQLALENKRTLINDYIHIMAH